ncbi:hypothetical protein JTE90_017229 [Oedothorax gibbosus]|uniref:Integrase catalytic domain-containing protein n=1 Tax=Oedothorax gibbosus TaxID=931172 RepID=A0AAV6VFK0_9ARAC|nr:hypothetical protein JTE90_017229 [Oedothorax gibbosus]
MTSSLWWNGPNWLVQEESSWPTNIPDLSNLKQFSSLRKVHRITAWILRFVNNARPKSSKLSVPLGATEISSAQTYWIRATQQRHYKEEVADLSKGKELDKSSTVRSTNPFLDKQGLLRLKGRLQFSNVSENEKQPWLLPSKDSYTELVVRDAHDKVLHAGVDATLAQVRESFWIVKGRQSIKTTIRECCICKRYSARPGSEEMAPLPPDRILEAPPFATTGLDFAGPLITKDSEEKHYILLFTCGVTRALHIELVNSMSTENFILAFRRFISRRGLCNTIYSDNAKTFKRADKELSKIWKCISHPSVKNMFANYGILWKYSVEKGPWWGGFWERQVRTIKTSLKKVIGRSTLCVKELETF